jgi:pSer/pThr/pTyr-binding forkhead associated (FHA) protein/ribosomal protein L40E
MKRRVVRPGAIAHWFAIPQVKNISGNRREMQQCPCRVINGATFPGRLKAFCSLGFPCVQTRLVCLVQKPCLFTGIHWSIRPTVRGAICIMIVCPNCNHQNPDGAVQCEACYTPLPAMMSCPNCGAAVQSDASFCGQCGFNLRAAGAEEPDVSTPTVAPDFAIPDLPAVDPLVPPDPLPDVPPLPPMAVPPDLPSAPVIPPNAKPVSEPIAEPSSAPVAPPLTPPASSPPVASPTAPLGTTQLQTQRASLLHVQTNQVIELPQSLTVIHLGKPNDRIPPDIDVSGFPSSEIVSRVHADIRVEGDAYYLEDVGSSNGTYVNNMPLPMGNRHRLRPGDRISLGKGDRVTFLFQLS